MVVRASITAVPSVVVLVLHAAASLFLLLFLFSSFASSVSASCLLPTLPSVSVPAALLRGHSPCKSLEAEEIDVLGPAGVTGVAAVQGASRRGQGDGGAAAFALAPDLVHYVARTDGRMCQYKQAGASSSCGWACAL